MVANSSCLLCDAVFVLTVKSNDDTSGQTSFVHKQNVLIKIFFRESKVMYDRSETQSTSSNSCIMYIQLELTEEAKLPQQIFFAAKYRR